MVLELKNEVGGKIRVDEGTDVTSYILLVDYELKIRYRIDDVVEKEYNCSSTYRLETMDRAQEQLCTQNFIGLMTIK